MFAARLPRALSRASSSSLTTPHPHASPHAPEQIQLREFLLLYTQGLDTKTKGAANTEDINNIFNALGGNPSNAEDAVERAHLVELILENYDLDIDIAFTFGKNVGSDGKLTKADIETMMVTKEAAA